ncbi:hypothetical protein [Puniceibacterium sp. IMCC21224]|uniref:hypothetical protein n=1 Tax=Puniceibacterium sp. IMCC21224 TaxID=1618204 RepID=UPI00064E0BCA|nr:hypothetical protein [Puniceibacterium sp. IMCC21224]KMK67038.1 hypothetical protein IMCC21224_111901 [Puniceibacterium sp. IMCC21224]
MSAARPSLAAGERTAAAMLDLPVTAFRRLVSMGALPQACRIGEFERWRIDDLRAILDGTAALPNEDFEI